jgi:multidrug transporter EmrE-like cation transporter
MYYGSICLAIIATLMYHLTQKLTPANANPALALTTTYLSSVLLCAPLFFIFPLKEGFSIEFRHLNWASFGLAFALVGLEVGFLLAYRARWNISLAAIVVNAVGAVLLVPLGLVLFREKLSLINLAGIAVCILGLVMVNIKP